MILAIDPGPVQSAFVRYDGSRVCSMGIVPNTDLLAYLSELAIDRPECVLEMVASYGMAVGAEVFETVYWIGRFAQAWVFHTAKEPKRLVRRDVKMHLCGHNGAKDSNLRAALLDKFGPGKERAVGTKKAPGPLYGVKADCWAALALAVTFAEQGARRAA